MLIKNIKNIKKSKIRLFPFQTKDHAFILYPDLPISYLLTLLVGKLGFSVNQFSVDYVFPFEKYIKGLLKNIKKYNEEYFIFYLENYFHSSEYALGFLELVLDELEKQKKHPYIIIHTLKTPKEKIKKLIEKYDFILVIVTGDLELFFYELFYEKKNIKKVGNIFFRNDLGEIQINKQEKIKRELKIYIYGAYYKGYYSYFPKNKDHIISLLDDNKKESNKDTYYRRPKEKVIKAFRYLPETEIMLTTGRGCKYNCTYCFRGLKYSKIRQISLAILKKDLDYLEELKYEYIYFYDDCFITTNLNRIDEIINLLSKYNFSYGIASRYEVCTPNILEKLSKLNIKRIQIGLQSVSLDVNIETRRGFNKKDFEKTLYNLNSLGIKVSLDLILGLPGEGLKGFINTFNYAVSLSPRSIFINSLFLNPGTDLSKNIDKYQIITIEDKGNKLLFNVPSIYSSASFSEKDLKVARKYVLYYINKIKYIYIVLR